MIKSFFNITVSGRVATIFLYGDIGDSHHGDVHSGDIARELKDAEGLSERIEIRINSMGGDVYSGIAIFNALRNSKADISLYVDGIAASMASVIALCGKPVYMSKYAQLMIHSVSGFCFGTKNDLKETITQIEMLENTLAGMYGHKTGQSAEVIRATYFDGKDHWFGADEALRLGFIDGLYDADKDAMHYVSTAVPAESTRDEIYQIFNNRLNKPQNENKMTFLERLRKNPVFQGASSDWTAQ